MIGGDPSGKAALVDLLNEALMVADDLDLPIVAIHIDEALSLLRPVDVVLGRPMTPSPTLDR